VFILLPIWLCRPGRSHHSPLTPTNVHVPTRLHGVTKQNARVWTFSSLYNLTTLIPTTSYSASTKTTWTSHTKPEHVTGWEIATDTSWCKHRTLHCQKSHNTSITTPRRATDTSCCIHRTPTEHCTTRNHTTQASPYRDVQIATAATQLLFRSGWAIPLDE
jgi:hypothetical protein